MSIWPLRDAIHMKNEWYHVKQRLFRVTREKKKKSALQRTEKQACIVNRWTRTSEFRHSRVAVCCRLDVFNKSASGSKRRWKLSCILVEESRVKFNISSSKELTGTSTYTIMSRSHAITWHRFTNAFMFAEI